jgi:hypothetical protein
MKRILVILVSLIVLMMIFTGCGGAPGVPVNILPAAFNLTAPLSSEQGILPVLSWGASLLADAYDIKLWKSTEAEDYLVQNLTATTYNVSTPLDYSSLYYWKVVAKNDDGVTESARGSFSTAPQKTGNYIEIKDIQTTTGATFTVILSGTVSNARGLEIILDYDSTQLEMAPNGDGDVTVQNISGAFGIVTKAANRITFSITKSSNFSLNHQEFLNITCDAKTLAGVFNITMNTSSEAIDENFGQINFDKSDKGYVFIN